MLSFGRPQTTGIAKILLSQNKLLAPLRMHVIQFCLLLCESHSWCSEILFLFSGTSLFIFPKGKLSNLTLLINLVFPLKYFSTSQYNHIYLLCSYPCFFIIHDFLKSMSFPVFFWYLPLFEHYLEGRTQGQFIFASSMTNGSLLAHKILVRKKKTDSQFLKLKYKQGELYVNT